MISAGQTVNPLMVGVTPLDNQYQSSSSSKVNVNLSGKEGADYLKRQQTWGSGLAAGKMVGDAILKGVALDMNFRLMKQFYGLQNKIADNTLSLGMRSVDLEFEKVATAERMNRQQMDFQRRVARIQSQTAVAVAHIQEKGKTNRAKVFTAFNAFKRNNYHSGQPMESSLMRLS